MVSCDDIVHIGFYFFDLIEHHRNIRRLTVYANWIHKLEVECTMWCSTVKSLLWCTFQGSVLRGVLGLYSDDYILVPLRLVGFIVILKNGLQFPMSFLYHANRLCMFDGCVLTANCCLFRRSFHYLGSKICAYVREYGVRNVRPSREGRCQIF